MQLVLRFSDTDYAKALESWSWLDVVGKKPLLATAFGDVFLEAQDGCWFLDSVEGTLTKVAPSKEDLQALLNTREGQDRLLLAGLATAADAAGLTLGPGQVYDFTLPPKLGGAFETSNLAVMSFVVSLNLAGQLLGQLKDLKLGTPISSIKLVPPTP